MREPIGRETLHVQRYPRLSQVETRPAPLDARISFSPYTTRISYGESRYVELGNERTRHVASRNSPPILSFNFLVELNPDRSVDTVIRC